MFYKFVNIPQPTKFINVVTHALTFDKLSLLVSWKVTNCEKLQTSILKRNKSSYDILGYKHSKIRAVNQTMRTVLYG